MKNKDALVTWGWITFILGLFCMWPLCFVGITLLIIGYCS